MKHKMRKKINKPKKVKKKYQQARGMKLKKTKIIDSIIK